MRTGNMAQDGPMEIRGKTRRPREGYWDILGIKYGILEFFPHGKKTLLYLLDFYL